jgi:hypothetical protein
MIKDIKFKSLAYLTIGWMLLGDPIAHLLPLVVYNIFQILFGILFTIGFIILSYIEKKRNEKHYLKNILCIIIIFAYTIITLVYCRYI